MKKIKTKDLILYSSVAAIYVVLTVFLGNFSFGTIQFRISEVLVLLCFFNRKFFIPLTLGCFISNLFSPYGLDIVFGTLATMISLVWISSSKRLFVASLYPVIFNGVIISLEICLLTNTLTFGVFLLNFLTIAIGEFTCVSVIGVIVFKALKNNDVFLKLIK